MNSYKGFVDTARDFPISFLFLEIAAIIFLVGFIVAMVIKLPAWQKGLKMWSEAALFVIGPLTLLELIALGIDSNWHLDTQFNMPWNLWRSTAHGTTPMQVWQVQLALFMFGIIFVSISVYLIVKAHKVNTLRLKQGLPKQPISSFINSKNK